MATPKPEVAFCLHAVFQKTRRTMAFFGLTKMGYQYPIGDEMIVNPRGGTHPQDPPGPLKCSDSCNVQQQQPLHCSSDIHRGSHERYKDMVKKVQTPTSPNQLYKRPLTANQQYGWMTSRSPEPWAQIKRFPRQSSEMTRFVKEMSTSDPNFSLF